MSTPPTWSMSIVKAPTDKKIGDQNGNIRKLSYVEKDIAHFNHIFKFYENKGSEAKFISSDVVHSVRKLFSV